MLDIIIADRCSFAATVGVFILMYLSVKSI